MGKPIESIADVQAIFDDLRRFDGMSFQEVSTLLAVALESDTVSAKC
jgi:hypothetical protein